MDQKLLNRMFFGGPVLCFACAFFITLYADPETVSYLADQGDNHASEDSANLFNAIFLFLPVVVSRFFFAIDR